MLDEAQQDFGPRSSVIDDGWIAGVMSHLPGIDRQVTAVRALRHAGEDGTSLALDLLPVLQDLHSGSSGGGSGVIKELASLGDTERTVISRAIKDLGSLDAAVAGIPSGSLFGPLDRLRTDAEKARQSLDGPVRAGLTILQTLPRDCGSGNAPLPAPAHQPRRGARRRWLRRRGGDRRLPGRTAGQLELHVVDLLRHAGDEHSGAGAHLRDHRHQSRAGGFRLVTQLSDHSGTRGRVLHARHRAAGRRGDRCGPDRAVVRAPGDRQRPGAALPAGGERDQFAPRAQLHHQLGPPRRPGQGVPRSVWACGDRRRVPDTEKQMGRAGDGTGARRRREAHRPQLQ